MTFKSILDVVDTCLSLLSIMTMIVIFFSQRKLSRKQSKEQLDVLKKEFKKTRRSLKRNNKTVKANDLKNSSAGSQKVNKKPNGVSNETRKKRTYPDGRMDRP